MVKEIGLKVGEDTNLGFAQKSTMCMEKNVNTPTKFCSSKTKCLTMEC